MSAMMLGTALSVLPWSFVADRIGRANAIKWSLALSAVLGVTAPLMPTFKALVAIRGLTGLALGAAPAVAMAYLAEEVNVRFIAAAAGLFVAGNTIGGVVVRIGASSLTDAAGWPAALFGAAIVTAAATIVFFLSAPRARGYVPRRVNLREVGHAVLFNVRDPFIRSLYALGFLNMGGLTALYNYTAYRLIAPPFGLPAWLAGFAFVAYLLGTVSAQVSGALVTRWGLKAALSAGFLLEITGALLLLTDSLVATVSGLAAITMGAFLIHPLASGQSGARA